ncbi:glycosyltransferase [Desulfomonile tiedjei]|uniref:Glycosyltransferase n=1 Tax=Desulfomonile tiedjei (strain ATCC 49306 / DSM 6799 / DCB-1) TaxID=706587 RepID=I4CCQ3_DESTA|nr:glycosyltransferase [Desulfomonile tiedjei]AFM27344.1 glycosyltransferase [Desulfomonile tiedjei DSM 6799]
MQQRNRAKPKVCIVTPEYPPEQWGGLARTVQRVSYHARDMGLNTHVAVFSIDPENLVLLDENHRSESLDGVTVHHITVGKQQMNESSREIWDCPHTYTVRMMYQSLEILHAREQFDLFHSFFLYPAGYVAGLVSRRFRKPSIVTIVGNDIKKYTFSPEKAAICRIGLENADRIVGLSRDLVEMADALVRIEEKSRIIYNSVRVPDYYRNERVTKQGMTRIGCAGIFKYAKGLPYLLKAAALLKHEYGFVLELRGHLRESETQVFDRMLEHTGMSGHVHLLEPVTHERISEWMDSLDLFVLPSVSEGCPNILMEAMASGVPSIATNTGAIGGLIENGTSGLIVPWGDSKALAGAMSHMMQNPELARNMGLAGRERMRKFSSDREFYAWRELYRELLEF